MLRIATATLLLLVSATLLLPTGGHSAPEAMMKRIGVVPLRDEGNVRNGAELLTEMLAGRLDARFEGVEFFVVDLADRDLPDGPLLLDEAVSLCQDYEADGLIDGVFGGIEIVGGSWPNSGSDVPQAAGYLRWRLVESGQGMLAADGNVDPDKPKVYSQRIRTEKALEQRVMQDLVQEVGDVLEDCGRLYGTGEEQ